MGIKEFILFLMVSFLFCHPVEFSTANLLENPEEKGLGKHSNHGVQIDNHGEFSFDVVSAKGAGGIPAAGGGGGSEGNGGTSSHTPNTGAGGGSEGNGGTSNTPNTGAGGSGVIPLTAAGAANNHHNHNTGGSCRHSSLGLPAFVLIFGSLTAYIAVVFEKY